MDDRGTHRWSADLPEIFAPDAVPSSVQLERFCAVVLEDVTLQDGLAAIEDLEVFIALVLEMAEARGSRFTASDIRAAMQTTHRVFCARLLVS
ncbi:hypothetical protein GCM10007874_32920 [Labrys miyagiensis]|uniref:Uncharacterized protein n=1 Tax=Labrys miyagiensis TaxID=346912 RepID=A0ABQ6CN02_9HYPH|nr:hypothetical protein [Labrys miyagiensis]GLS20275.1 hypothetical protein GCM10007874_32920 [Labrys miyagiensis]